MASKATRGVVVVTGASSGIGRATAIHLADKGFEVFAGVRKKKDADALRKEGRGRKGRLTPVTLDVTKPRSISTAAAAVRKRAGRRGLAGLVNNAGVGVGGPVEYLPLDELRRQLEVNLIGQIAVIQEFLPLLRKAKGRIVNMTSVGGRMAHPFMSPYHASKFGLEAVTESLRMELQPWGIWVCAVEPGNVSTRIWEKAERDVKKTRTALPSDGEDLYGDAMDGMERVVEESDGAGIPPERVAKKVQHALTARRPRPRYLVGSDAKAGLAARRVLGARLFDRARTGLMKQPKKNSKV